MNAQPRCLPLFGCSLLFSMIFAGLAAPASALVILSEIFYDAEGSDDGHVFVELAEPPGTLLDGRQVEGINGFNGAVWTGELRRHGLSAAVDAVVFCVDVGWRKPEPRIFQHALSRIGVEARAAAFVGDDPRQDIAGAEQSGLYPILLDPGGDTPNAHCRRIRSLTELTALLPTVATP